ncbi:MAG: DUF3817 domain-containing protein [Leeuwenhoekiella sp.]
MLKTFHFVSLLEGISFLLILFVTMPLKYIWETPEPNQIIGMAHGVLFIGYIVLAVMVKNILNWDAKTFLIVLVASIVPFGTFWMDKKYLQPHL